MIEFMDKYMVIVGLIDKYFGNYTFFYLELLTILFIGLLIIFALLFIPVKNIFLNLINFILFISLCILLGLFYLLATISVFYPNAAVIGFLLLNLAICFPWLIIIYEKCSKKTYTHMLLDRFVNNKKVRIIIYTLLVMLPFIIHNSSTRSDYIFFSLYNCLISFEIFLNFLVLQLWVKLKKSQNPFWNKFKNIITKIYIGICIIGTILLMFLINPIFMFIFNELQEIAKKFT